MTADRDASVAAAETAYRRLAEASPADFRNLVFQQGVALVHLLVSHRQGDEARRAETRAMVARVACAYDEMAKTSPNEWIRREAARRLTELEAASLPIRSG